MILSSEGRSLFSRGFVKGAVSSDTDVHDWVVRWAQDEGRAASLPALQALLHPFAALRCFLSRSAATAVLAAVISDGGPILG